VTGEDGEGLADEARRRASSYWLLAGFYLDPPTAESLVRLADALVGVERDSEDPIANALGRLRDSLSSCDPGDLAQRLAPEHLRLTGGLKPGYGPPPPYESVFREGGVAGERTMGVLKAYADAGLDFDGGFSVPGDHLGVELKFLALACSREAEAREAGRVQAVSEWIGRQARFLEWHLAPWVGSFCAEMRRYATEPFYHAVADLTEAACRLDLERVRQMTGVPASDR